MDTTTSPEKPSTGRTARQVSVSMFPEDIERVERFGRENGIKGFSAALQAMLYQLDQARQRNGLQPKA